VARAKGKGASHCGDNGDTQRIAIADRDASSIGNRSTGPSELGAYLGGSMAALSSRAARAARAAARSRSRCLRLRSAAVIAL
jgi:hypothetical protein